MSSRPLEREEISSSTVGGETNTKVIPPEILGHIFVLAINRNQDCSLYLETSFDGLEKGSYNFLLVCRRWFSVAIDTPDLWTFWGNTLEVWNKRSLHHRTRLAVDLVLDGHATSGEELGITLQNELKSHATQNKIRRIHLRGTNHDLLGAILSLLTPEGDVVQEKCIESIIIDANTETLPNELDKFFARSRLPMLRYLEILGNPQPSLLDQLASQITCLTILSLRAFYHSPGLTTPQLISILKANPNLQDLALCGLLPENVENSGSRVPLDQLRKITLHGTFNSIFQLLEGLKLPELLDCMCFVMEGPTEEDFNLTLAPFIQDLFRRDHRFKGPLTVVTKSPDQCAVILFGPFRHDLVPPEQVLPRAEFWVAEPYMTPPLDLKRDAINLTKFIPQEHVEHLETEYISELPEFLAAMPNLKQLVLKDATLPDGFLQAKLEGNSASWTRLPSLQYLDLQGLTVLP